MKKKVLFFALLLILLAMLPTLAMADTMWVQTPNYTPADMRMGPSIDDMVLTRVPYGAAVEVVYDLLGSSYLHCWYRGTEGYIQSRYLANYQPEQPYVPYPVPTQAPIPKNTPKPASNKGTSYNKFKPALYLAAVVPSNPSAYVNMRWAPDKNAKVQEMYYNAQTLLVISENGTWSQVYDLERHKSGFMASSFLRYYAPYDENDVGSMAPSVKK